jgi:hypothetical protein
MAKYLSYLNLNSLRFQFDNMGVTKMKVLHNRTNVMFAFGVLHILSKGVKRYFNSNTTYILQYF